MLSKKEICLLIQKVYNANTAGLIVTVPVMLIAILLCHDHWIEYISSYSATSGAFHFGQSDHGFRTRRIDGTYTDFGYDDDVAHVRICYTLIVLNLHKKVTYLCLCKLIVV